MPYHINPTTGKPGLCKAKENCPFGDMQADHYPTVTAAQEAFEATMKASTVPSGSRLKPASTVALSSIMDLDLLAKMQATDMLDVREHEDDPQLKILCYSRNAQYAGAWNEVTKNARGLIVRADKEDFSDAVIIERPWRKFFTLEQHDAGWALGDEENPESAADNLRGLDFNAPAEVTDKMDGSMGVLYRHPDGGPALSTKGSFGSEQAYYYTAMLRQGALKEEAEALLAQDGDKTFLFEMVGKDNRIVLNYENDGIVLLGAVEKKDGLYLSANAFAERWSGGVTETMQAATVAEALSLPDREQKEGVVIRIISDDPAKQMQLKVKQEDYKMLHRAITSFSKSDMRSSVRESSASMTDLLDAEASNDVELIPGVKEQIAMIKLHEGLEAIVEQRQDAYKDAIMPRLKKLRQAKDYVDALPAEALTQPDAAKKFAATVMQMKELDRADLFSFFQARHTGRPIEGLSTGSLLRKLSQEIK